MAQVVVRKFVSPCLYVRNAMKFKKISKVTYVFSILLIRFRVQERPATVVEESFDIVGDSFHDLRPVQRLNTFRVANVTRAEKDKEIHKTF